MPGILYLFLCLIGGLVMGYSLLLFYLTLVNHRAGKQQQKIATLKEKPFVSICVAFRNERENLPDLLDSLAKQDYPKERWELILVNDHSDDNGPEWLENQLLSYPISLKLIDLTDGNSGKKAALALAINTASGDWILSTDADCTLPTTWISTLVGLAVQKNEDLVCGPVFIKNRSLWESVQALEFSSLVAVAAAGIHLKKPNFCNAANILFRKSTWESIQKERTDLNLPGGDDVFFMHQIHQNKGNIGFCMGFEGRVETKGQPDWATFESQRIRWASKIKAGIKGANLNLAILVWLFHLLFLLWLGIGISVSSIWLSAILILKIAAEISFLHHFQLKSRGPIFWVLVGAAQIFYSLYVLYFGIRILFSSHFAWKGRQF